MRQITNCLGYQQIAAASTTAATKLTVPANRLGIKPTWCLIQAETQALRYRDDGVAPTTSVGQLIPAGATLEYTGDINNIQLINATAGAIANITYYA